MREKYDFTFITWFVLPLCIAGSGFIAGAGCVLNAVDKEKDKDKSKRLVERVAELEAMTPGYQRLIVDLDRRILELEGKPPRVRLEAEGNK